MNLARERKKIERLTKEGLKGLGSNDYEAAWRGFEQILFIDEDDPTANTAGGFCLLKLGRIEDAEVLVRKAIRLMPQEALPHYYLALVLIAKGEYEEAEAEVWETVTINPHDPKTRTILAELLLLREREADLQEQARKLEEICRAFESAYPTECNEVMSRSDKLDGQEPGE